MYVCKSTYTRRIEIKVSLLRRGLAKKKCLLKSFKVSKFNVRLPLRRVDCSKFSDPRPRNSAGPSVSTLCTWVCLRTKCRTVLIIFDLFHSDDRYSLYGVCWRGRERRAALSVLHCHDFLVNDNHIYHINDKLQPFSLSWQIV